MDDRELNISLECVRQVLNMRRVLCRNVPYKYIVYVYVYPLSIIYSRSLAWCGLSHEEKNIPAYIVVVTYTQLIIMLNLLNIWASNETLNIIPV